MAATAPSPRSAVRRLPERASYEREAIQAILDEGLVCHVGFVADGQPFVIPCVYARIDERLYLHGSPASRMLRAIAAGAPLCVTVTLLDGLVLARSAFHHSMNYRSAVVFGKAEEVTDRDEKLRVLAALVEHVCRGRSGDARRPNEKELKQTIVLRLPIAEASAKVRTGGPKDDEEDYALPIWAGVLPLAVVPGAPVSDNNLSIPEYVVRYQRPVNS